MVVDIDVLELDVFDVVVVVGLVWWLGSQPSFSNNLCGQHCHYKGSRSSSERIRVGAQEMLMTTHVYKRAFMPACWFSKAACSKDAHMMWGWKYQLSSSKLA